MLAALAFIKYHPARLVPRLAAPPIPGGEFAAPNMAPKLETPLGNTP